MKLVKTKIVFLLCLILSTKTFAISELSYQEDYKKTVKPFLESFKEGHFDDFGIKIHYRTKASDLLKSCLVVLPGRAEPLEKYAEMMYDISQTNFGKNVSYFILDHRGQGQSDRMTKIEDMGYVDHFSDYINDLNTFLTKIVNANHCEKKFLYAHSMGAAIALSYIVDHPDYFTAIAISSPMLKLQTKPFPYPVAWSLVASNIALGRADEFALGQKGYDAEDDHFETNKYTTSLARFNKTQEFYKEIPKTQLGGVSNRWVYEAMKATKKLRHQYAHLNVPMRLYRAGIELYSVPEEMHKMCETVSHCEELVLKTAKHEVINDRDENREQVIHSLMTFFGQY